MPRRKYQAMARPRKRSASRRRTRKPATTNAKGPSQAQRLVQAVLSWLAGPAGQQILALALIAWGGVTLVSLVPRVNSGALIGLWVRLIVFLFGWGAYAIAVGLMAAGLLWLRHLVHQPMVWRWRPILGFELTLIGLLTLSHAFLRQRGWQLVESGRGGGVIGWALCLFFATILGPLITQCLMGLMVALGLALTFDLTLQDFRRIGIHLAELWRAWRAARQAQKERRAAATLTVSDEAATLPQGVAVSPLSRHKAPQPTPESKAAPAQPTRKKSRPRRPRATSSATLVPLDLLQESQTVGMNPEEITRKRRIIEETLAQFGVPAKVTEVRPGPIVTQFGVSPGYISRGTEGQRRRKVRVSQIASLADDLALALAAPSLRVEAPVPGRAVVGIEVPNAETSLVRLRAVLESDAYRRCTRPLCFAVGLDVAGTPQVADLARMPHLLVAGTTGSGKSVFVKSLAASLVMRNTPDTLRLIAIDPKMVELSHLNGLPHLLGMAETSVERGLRVLRWVAHEMDVRYKRFAELTARNLEDYNTKVTRKRSGKEPLDDAKPLPRIVVLIDELADLMLFEPEETERLLTRIAQMARATGIHLVVATQRPSTDVVTGLIKANFPARVSFATASIVDSRVILDTPGAETLLGRGDMLFLRPDASSPMRIQGCFISEDELEAIIHYWQQEIGATPAKPPWDAVSEARGPEQWRIEGLDKDADLLEQAIAYARSQGSVSTSGIQRRLRISYPRAARLMEQMENMGIVGPQESAGRKRRVILGGEEDPPL